MKVCTCKDVPTRGMEGRQEQGVVGRIVIEKNEHENSMRVFTVEPGGITTRHSHEWAHEVFVHSGRGQVYKSGEWCDLCSGTALFIAAGEEHQFMNAGNEDFVFMCLNPSETRDN